MRSVLTPDRASLLDEGAQLLRVESSIRDHSAEVRVGGSWACIPTRCSMTSSAGRSTRSSRSWRPRSVRLRARLVRTGAVGLPRVVASSVVGEVREEAPDHAGEPGPGLGPGFEDLLVGQRLARVARPRRS